MKSDIGNLYALIEEASGKSSFSLSLLNREWGDVEQWRTAAQVKLHELLGLEPEGAPMAATTVSMKDMDGYTEEVIDLKLDAHSQTTASFLLPKQGNKPFPCIIALHDHSGFYYFGREKIIENEREPGILSGFKKECYGGRSWASELARRGYAVFVMDALYFGAQKLDFSAVSDEMLQRCPQVMLPDLNEDAYIQAYNKNALFMEGLVHRHMLAAGITWPGVLFHQDRKSVDYVLSRPEVDPDRIGCCGLSVGAYRSLHLLALDPRIRCASAAGFMASWGPMLSNKIRYHTFMLYIPRLYSYLDLPDVAGLGVPKPLLVQQCGRDELFTTQAMSAGEQKLKRIYSQLNANESLKVSWHDVPHLFNVSMQEEAFSWFDQWLQA